MINEKRFSLNDVEKYAAIRRELEAAENNLIVTMREIDGADDLAMTDCHRWIAHCLRRLIDWHDAGDCHPDHTKHLHEMLDHHRERREVYKMRHTLKRQAA